MKYLINLLINSVMFIVLIAAGMYIYCVATHKTFEFNYLYNLVVPIVCGLVATEARTKRKK